MEQGRKEKEVKGRFEWKAMNHIYFVRAMADVFWGYSMQLKNELEFIPKTIPTVTMQTARVQIDSFNHYSDIRYLFTTLWFYFPYQQVCCILFLTGTTALPSSQPHLH